MRVRDLNARPGAPEQAAPDRAPPDSGMALPALNGHAAPSAAVSPARAEAEIALLRARIAHLETVLEAARGFMTSNQERLLRRLHDLPQELVTLSSQFERLSAAQAGSAKQEHAP